MQKDMLGRGAAVSAEEALSILLGLPFMTTSPEDVPLEHAFQRVLSEDIISPEDLPPFPRSTVDGYAVRASDTHGCSETLPAYLRLTGEVAMGKQASGTVGGEEAHTIPTGGMLPAGSDAVVMLEHVQHTGDDMIEVLRPVSTGENVIRAGEDVSKGEVVLQKGRVLASQDIGALAGIGRTTVSVFRKPIVGIISTGDEIVPIDREPGPGEVRDINSYTLDALIRSAGGVPEKFGIIQDRFETLLATLKQALEKCDVVLISGGSSVGTRDHTAGVMEAIETGSVKFHGVAMKPGKPLIAGFLLGKPVFGLPGHPAAVAVSFMNFVKPVILKVGGAEKADRHDVVSAKLGKNVSSAAGREDHVRVALIQKDGELIADPVHGKSGLIRTLVEADGILVIASHLQGIAKGETVQVRLLERS